MKRPLLALVLVSFTLAGCGSKAEQTAEVPDDAIVMTSNAFEPASRTLTAGDTITFVNEATGALHILVIGDNGIAHPAPGAPDIGGAAGHRSQRGDVWTTPAWTTPGTYKLTCTVHAEMTLTVDVKA